MTNIDKIVNQFLSKHKFGSSFLNFEELVSAFIVEMEKGLVGEVSCLRMLPTYVDADNVITGDHKVLAVDAGGTNFRVSQASYNSAGMKMGEIHRYAMPGLEGEISAQTFFEIMSSYIKDKVDGYDKIGFCFSYPTEIQPNKDGRLLQFSKEVQAPEVLGELIGERLLKTMGVTNKTVVLLNDTVATLLSGKSVKVAKEYDSYIGFILGTGTNTCYVEPNSNIKKIKESSDGGAQIINIESGNFNKLTQSAIDIEFDNTTTSPGDYIFEKMLSGAYVGKLSFTLLSNAVKDGLFADTTNTAFRNLNEISTADANSFVGNSSSPLSEIFLGEEAEIAKQIISSVIDRAAYLSAINIAAVILKSGKGQNQDKPILITIEGTAFYKLEGLQSKFHNYLDQYLVGDKKRYYEFVNVEESSLLGAALAGLLA
jgi:hexokinase